MDNIQLIIDKDFKIDKYLNSKRIKDIAIGDISLVCKVYDYNRLLENKVISKLLENEDNFNACIASSFSSNNFELSERLIYNRDNINFENIINLYFENTNVYNRIFSKIINLSDITFISNYYNNFKYQKRVYEYNLLERMHERYLLDSKNYIKF